MSARNPNSLSANNQRHDDNSTVESLHVSVIDSFEGFYDFLSLEYPCEVYLDHVGPFPSAAHALLLAAYGLRHIESILQNPSDVFAAETHILSAGGFVRPEWKDLKSQWLLQAMRDKFVRSDILTNRLLTDTGSRRLRPTFTRASCAAFLGLESVLGQALERVREDAHSGLDLAEWADANPVSSCSMTAAPSNGRGYANGRAPSSGYLAREPELQPAVSLSPLNDPTSTIPLSGPVPAAESVDPPPPPPGFPSVPVRYFQDASAKEDTQGRVLLWGGSAAGLPVSLPASFAARGALKRLFVFALYRGETAVVSLAQAGARRQVTDTGVVRTFAPAGGAVAVNGEVLPPFVARQVKDGDVLSVYPANVEIVTGETANGDCVSFAVRISNDHVTRHLESLASGGASGPASLTSGAARSVAAAGTTTTVKVSNLPFECTETALMQFAEERTIEVIKNSTPTIPVPASSGASGVLAVRIPRDRDAPQAETATATRGFAFIQFATPQICSAVLKASSSNVRSSQVRGANDRGGPRRGSGWVTLEEVKRTAGVPGAEDTGPVVVWEMGGRMLRLEAAEDRTPTRRGPGEGQGGRWGGGEPSFKRDRSPIGGRGGRWGSGGDVKREYRDEPGRRMDGARGDERRGEGAHKAERGAGEARDSKFGRDRERERSRSPVRSRSYRERSRTPERGGFRDRSRSPIKREEYRGRDRSLSPVRSYRDRSRTPVRRDAARDRSRSPLRRDAQRDRSHSPPRRELIRRERVPSPLPRSTRDRSRTPERDHLDRSRPPVGRSYRERSPDRYHRERSRTPPTRSYRDRSPVPVKRERSRSPIRSYRERSNSPVRRYRERSRSPIGRGPARERSRSRSPVRRSRFDDLDRSRPSFWRDGERSRSPSPRSGAAY